MSEEWHITKLVPGGAGMARLRDGRVGFALGALPNERIEVEASRAKKGYVEALRFRVLVSAKERVAPPCPFVDACGGCDFLHVEYGAQLAFKSALLGEALERTGGFQGMAPIEVDAAPRPLGYRSRLRVHIDSDGEVGFFARKSHRLVVVASCAVARSELDAALSLFRETMARTPHLARHFREAELRAAPSASRPSVRLVPRLSAEKAQALTSPLLATLSESFAVSIAGLPSDFAERWPLADDLAVWVPPEAFVQVNWEVNLSIGRALVDGARARSVKSFVELYAGAGNFTIVLLAAGLTGTAIESVPEAVRAAERSLREQGLSRGRVVAGDAARSLRDWSPAETPDLIVLDPPRAGAAELVEPLARMAPRFIAYCSCDPVTLARDLRSLVARGYELEAVRGFDMFPGTHHVEALAWLRRA